MSEIKLTVKNIGILTADGWTLWSRKCKSVLQSNGLWTYIEGADSMKPADNTKIDDWHHTNDQIVGALCQVIDNSLAQEIKNLTSAHDAWETLKSKTYQNGTISKFNALQNAMRPRFTTPDTANATIADIRDLVEIIYDKTPLTKDEMLITLYQHVMADGDFNWLWKILIGSMTSLTITLTPAEITRHLELEAQEARHHDSTKEGEKLLTTRQKKPKGQRSSTKCTNCQCSGHAIEKCWKECRGSVGGPGPRMVEVSKRQERW